MYSHLSFQEFILYLLNKSLPFKIFEVGWNIGLFLLYQSLIKFTQFCCRCFEEISIAKFLYEGFDYSSNSLSLNDLSSVLMTLIESFFLHTTSALRAFFITISHYSSKSTAFFAKHTKDVSLISFSYPWYSYFYYYQSD
jgi:hypothetical protein